MVGMDELAVEMAKVVTRLDNTDSRIASLEITIKRIESLTLSVEKLAMSVEDLAKKQGDYKTSQDVLINRVDEIENTPNKEKASKLDKLIEKIVGLLLAGVIGFLLNSLLGI